MKKFTFFLTFVFSVHLNAETLLEFSDVTYLERYQKLIKELRCPKCQNQNIADSNSPISKDLRKEITILLERGLDDDQIKIELASRYSDFILYDPKFGKQTYFLWLTPLLIFLFGFWFIYSMFVKREVNQAKKEDKHQ
jgi:cytochrome c-type biogenesis protein CcmH